MYYAYFSRLEQNVCKKKLFAMFIMSKKKKLWLHYVHPCLVTILTLPAFGYQLALVFSSHLNFLASVPSFTYLYSSWNSWRNCSCYVPQPPVRLLIRFQLWIKYVLNHVKKIFFLHVALNNIYSSSSYRYIIFISLQTVPRISDTVTGVSSPALLNWHHLSNWLT